MHVFHYVGSYHRMQVRFHEIEYKIDVLVVLGFQNVEERYDVGVSVELLQEDDLDRNGIT